MADSIHPVTIHVLPEIEGRNRLTTAFRFFLGIPHILLVGGPAAGGAWISWQTQEGMSWSSSAGVLGAVAGVVTLIAWFAILFTGSHPDGLWRLAAYYLRWRVRAVAYLMLLRDEYPPFGDGAYPAELVLPEPTEERDRLTVFFRILLAIPHLIILALLFVIWAFTTAIAWVMILLTGSFPETLYGFALGVLAWTTRVEAYLLLLTDEYPPFSLRV
ncbi:MAG TPA: DUF4389 domain-containing protein [Longimicrobiales bacterium]|nr:DUF4389 domain-containing protein [Longimicrobiales bacterium]